MQYNVSAEQSHCELIALECDGNGCGRKDTARISIPISPEYVGDYTREAFYDENAIRSWGDDDADCQDTRAEVLIASSLIPVVYGGSDCWVEAGLWHDVFSNRFLENPSDVEIDHVVSLKEAHESGAYQWSQEKRYDFANDFTKSPNLLPLWYSTNRSKGAREPHEWLPPETATRCFYVSLWAAVKTYWGLSVDSAECTFLAQFIESCANGSVQSEK